MKNIIFVKEANLATANNFSPKTLLDNQLGIYFTDFSGANKQGLKQCVASAPILQQNRGVDTVNFTIRSTVFGTPTYYDIPVGRNGLTFTKSEYKADTKFSASFVVTAPTLKGEYSVTIVKKGAINSERYKWTTSVYIDRPPMDVSKLAEAIVKDINSKKETLGLTAANVGANVTITNTVDTTDFELILTDNLAGTPVTYATRGLRGQNDEEFVRDLLEKHASNFGYNYTADGADLYPGYGKADLSVIAPNKQFTIYYINFVNKRAVKTHDDNIKQQLIVVVPQGWGGATNFEAILKSMN